MFTKAMTVQSEQSVKVITVQLKESIPVLVVPQTELLKQQLETNAFLSAIRDPTGYQSERVFNSQNIHFSYRFTPIDTSYLPCLDVFESMKQCFFFEIKRRAEKKFQKIEKLVEPENEVDSRRSDSTGGGFF